MSLKRILEQVNDPKYIITPKLNDYLLATHGRITEEAMDRVIEEFKRPGRDRSKSFSASSAGECLRRQELAFLGMPQKTVYPDLQMVFDTGTWLGAQFQALLLSAGLIDDIEVAMPWRRMASMGSADGTGTVNWDTINPAYKGRRFILELKTVSAFMLPKAIEAGVPKEAHMKQITRYSLHSGIDLAVYIMLDKGNVLSNDGWHEMVVEITDEMREESRQELEELNAAAKKKELHPILPACKIGTGTQYAYCPFSGKSGACKMTTEWPQ